MNSNDHNPSTLLLSQDLDFKEGDRLYLLSQYSEAYQAYQALLENISASADTNISKLASLYHNLGLCSFKLGKFSEAHNFLQKALDKAKLSGNDLLKIARILYANGAVYTRESSFTEAEENLKMAIDLVRSNFGEDHREMIACYNRLAYLSEQKELYKEEREHLSKAFKISSLLNIELDAELATSYYHSAINYWYEDENDNANEAIQKCLFMRKEIYGEDHVETALCYKIFGDVQYSKGNYDEALEYYEQGIKLIVKFFDESHLELDDFYCNMGRVYLDLQQYDKSLECHRKTLEIEKSFFPEDHQYIAYTYGDFGNIYKMQGRYQEALDMYDKALEQFIRKLGENHWRTANFLNEKSGVYVQQEQYSKARKLVKKQLEIETKFYGPKDMNLVPTLNYLAWLYFKDKNYKRVLDKYLMTLSIMSGEFKANMTDVADNFCNLSWIFKYICDLESCANAAKKYSLCYQKAKGKNHHRTRRSTEFLEKAQQKKDLYYINDKL